MASVINMFYYQNENNVDPDQLASQKPVDLGLTVFKTGYIRVQHGKC